jgi:hypothetical protein
MSMQTDVCWGGFVRLTSAKTATLQARFERVAALGLIGQSIAHRLELRLEHVINDDLAPAVPDHCVRRGDVTHCRLSRYAFSIRIIFALVACGVDAPQSGDLPRHRIRDHVDAAFAPPWAASHRAVVIGDSWEFAKVKRPSRGILRYSEPDLAVRAAGPIRSQTASDGCSTVCGLAGFVGRRHGGARRMTDAIRHRGPDAGWSDSDAGVFWVFAGSPSLIAGGSRSRWTRTVKWAIFSDEIENHLELRGTNATRLPIRDGSFGYRRCCCMATANGATISSNGSMACGHS